MLAVVMTHQGLDIQAAADLVGELWHRRMDSFIKQRENLPSWNTDIDEQVKLYVDGLCDSVVACMHWAFESERYFGKQGLEVKKMRIVTNAGHKKLPYSQMRLHGVVARL